MATKVIQTKLVKTNRPVVYEGVPYPANTVLSIPENAWDVLLNRTKVEGHKYHDGDWAEDYEGNEQPANIKLRTSSFDVSDSENAVEK